MQAKQPKVTITIKLPIELDKKLSELVTNIGIPKSSYILNLVYHEVHKEFDNLYKKEGLEHRPL